MADYRYRTRHHPARRSDRIEVRPGEHLAAAFAALIGVVLVVAVASPAQIVGISHLPNVVVAVVGVLLFIGGLACLAGLQWPRSGLSVGWMVERIGCLVTMSGWAAASIVLTQVDPLMLFGLLVTTFLAVFNFARFRLLNLVELQARTDTGKVAT